MFIFGRMMPVNVPIQGEAFLKVMSIGFLLENKDASVVWRGPKKSGTITRYNSI